MKKVLFLACLFAMIALHAQMNVTLLFSTDNGKTWEEDFPVLADGKREFLVKAVWKVVSDRPMRIVTTSLACPERDFASANVGHRSEYGKEKKGAWWQSLNKYWANPASLQPFVYKVDLGERKAGVMGMRNKWDREKKRYINVPLPPLAAFGPGTYRFTLTMTCWGKEANDLAFEPYKDFDVIIQK